VYVRISMMYVQGSVIIFNFLKFGLQLEVFEILAIILLPFFVLLF
jgi:hypothetical protein